MWKSADWNGMDISHDQQGLLRCSCKVLWREGEEEEDGGNDEAEWHSESIREQIGMD